MLETPIIPINHKIKNYKKSKTIYNMTNILNIHLDICGFTY